MTTRKILFTAEDVRVLRQIKEIEQLGANGARLILSAPVVALLTAGSAVELAVTLSDTDWNEIATGIKSIQKVAACTAMSLLIEHLDAGVPQPTGAAQNYFEHLRENTARKCSG